MSGFGYTNNSMSDFSIKDCMKVMKEAKQKVAQYELDRCGLNLDMLQNKCPSCGHTMKLDGMGLLSRIEVCAHQLEDLKRRVPPPSESSPWASNPMLGSFYGIEIVLKEPTK